MVMLLTDHTTLPALNRHSLRIQIAFLSTFTHEVPDVEHSSGTHDGIEYVLEGTTMFDSGLLPHTATRAQPWWG
jgi:hypothetical protein